MKKFAHIQKKLVCILIFTFFVTSCNCGTDYINYISYISDLDNGLTHERDINDIIITCSYRPKDLVIAQELGKKESTNLDLIDSLNFCYSGKIHCVLTLSYKKAEIENLFISNSTEYFKIINYLNTGIAADVMLSTFQDSVTASASLYTRQFGNTGRSTVILIFDASQLRPQEGFIITFRDTHFGLGTQRFYFKAKDISALPALKL